MMNIALIGGEKCSVREFSNAVDFPLILKSKFSLVNYGCPC